MANEYDGMDLQGQSLHLDDYKNSPYPKGRQQAIDTNRDFPDTDGVPHEMISGGQTDYRRVTPPFFEAIQSKKPVFRRKVVDNYVMPVPLAIREDTALMPFDYGQQQYNATLDGSGNRNDPNAFTVETDWQWFIQRVAIFGSGLTVGTGFVKLYDGPNTDDSNVMAFQVGGTGGGGITPGINMLATQRTQLGLIASGAGNNGTLSIGIWYLRCKWVWVPQTYFQEDRLSSD